jgi:hypothetical protein
MNTVNAVPTVQVNMENNSNRNSNNSGEKEVTLPQLVSNPG